MSFLTATARYEHKVHIECPQCKFDLQIRIINPLDISNVPQVGETCSCPACGTTFKIGSEELY